MRSCSSCSKPTVGYVQGRGGAVRPAPPPCGRPSGTCCGECGVVSCLECLVKGEGR